MKSDIDEGRIIQAEASLPGHESGQEQSSGSNLYKHPKPVKRQRINDIKHRKERSKAQERELARSYRKSGLQEAKRIAGSGSWGEVVADVDPGEWLLVEAKETRGGKLVINSEWVSKIAHQSRQMARPWWALHCWVGETTGPYEKVVILDEKHFFEIIKLLKELTNDC